MLPKTSFDNNFFSFKNGYAILTFIVKWTFICIIIGALIGSASAAFLVALDWVTNFRESNLWIIVFLPIAGFVVACLYHFFGKNIEAGNNLLFSTIHQPKEIIPFKMAPFIFLGTIITHLFGGSAGREGTALQMAGAIADQFSKPLKLSIDERRILIIAAIAAGFGSVFGTPIAGAIFGLEVLIAKRLNYHAIFPAFLASSIANNITKFWNVGHTQFNMGVLPQFSFLNLFYIILAGIFFGLCASLFCKSMHTCSTFYKTAIKFPPLRAFVGGVVVVFLIWILATTKFIGLGVPTIVDSFSRQLPMYDFLLKLIFTVLTISAGFKGGEVTPLFFIGALLGNALSYILPLPIGFLAGMGFVAVFAGATNCPLACIFMATELFCNECAIFVAVACIISYLVSGKSSIYSIHKINATDNQ
jgi:H+/Cl- antiporter ClcA